MRLTGSMPDRAAGVLLASAAGDALGAGYEFSYPRVEDPIDMIGGGPFGFAPGEWTDDTSMTVAVARVTANGIDLRSAAGLDGVAVGFGEWFADDPKDVGNQTRAVLSARDISGAEMRSTARKLIGKTGGNGSLMRTAAVGVAYLDDEKACAQAALAVSELTHHDERAGQACQLWSHAIRHAVLHGTFEGVHGYLDTDGADAEFWRPLLLEAERGTPQDFPNNGWVVHALQTAWWAITHATSHDAHHLEEALELAVRAGHDTDTTAAIAGALLGARWGASAVPARWRRILHGWPGLRAKDLMTLGLLTAGGGRDDSTGWPSIGSMDYTGWQTGRPAVQHPHDSGLFVGGYQAAVAGGRYDAVVSLCRMGSTGLNTGEHVEFWLADKGPAGNPNLTFVLDDAVRTIKELRADGKIVLVHCVEGSSRTPSVAARYSVMLGKNPQDVLTAMPWARPNQDLWKAAVG
jgi:ADP-ribosylglycohydrolase